MRDLTVGKANRVILAYVLPLFGSIVFQQLYNIADSVIAGKFIGEQALAAVGNSYEINLIYLAFAIGCNTGASIITAKFFGIKDYTKMKTAINTSILSSLAVCTLLFIIGLSSGRGLLIALNTPQDIFDDSLLYFYIYTGGIIFLFMYNIATGIFAAIGDSKTPFIFLVVSSLANIGMDIIFVVVFKMGVAGVGWATFICQGVSCILSTIVLYKKIHEIKANKPKLFDIDCFKNFLYVSIPSTIQQAFVSVSNISLQGLINASNPIGSVSVTAGYSAAIKFNNFTVQSLAAMGNGISNYTAQNLSVGKVDRVKEGFKWGCIIASIISILFSTLYLTANRQIMLLFLNKDSVDAIEVGHNFMMIVSPFYLVISFKVIADGVQRGAERMMAFTTSTIFDLILRLIFAFSLVTTMLGTNGIWWGWPIGWVLSTVYAIILYFYGKWKYSSSNCKLLYTCEKL